MIMREDCLAEPFFLSLSQSPDGNEEAVGEMFVCLHTTFVPWDRLSILFPYPISPPARILYARLHLQLRNR